MRQLWALGVAAAAFAVLAPSASAADVWLWACHGPDGASVREFSGHAEGPAGAEARCAGDSSLRAGTWTFFAPFSTSITGVRADPAVEPLPEVTGAKEVTLTGDVGLRAVALQVHDDLPPVTTGIAGPAQVVRFVGRPTPPLDFTVTGSDAGLGLWSATAAMDGLSTTARFAPPSCAELSAGNLALGDIGGERVTGAPPPYQRPAGCPQQGAVPLSLDVSSLPDGVHALRITVTDIAGNVSPALTRTIDVSTYDLGARSVNLVIGTSVNPQSGGAPGGGGGTGGVADQSAGSCRAPTLSMVLAQKPLRIRRGVPVLRSGKRYRFRGRLTCVVDGRRRPAPKRTRIVIFNKVGRHTVRKARATVGAHGRIVVRLACKRSRTLIFRFTNGNGNGKRYEVRIRIRVAKR